MHVSQKGAQEGAYHLGQEVVRDGHPTDRVALQICHLLLQAPAQLTMHECTCSTSQAANVVMTLTG